jgi:hypothetical protein
MTDDTFETRVARGDLPPLADAPVADPGAVPRLAVPVTAPAGAPAIVTPEPPSFRRSEAYLAGRIARAVARGQRVL